VENEAYRFSMTDLKCVTANLEKAHNRKTLPWLEQVLDVDRPALVFGQELKPESVEGLAKAHEYQFSARRSASQSGGWAHGSWFAMTLRRKATRRPYGAALSAT
jgi:hypothetical protein